MEGRTEGQKERRTERQKDGRTDVSKFPPVFYRTSALWGRCPKRKEGKKEGREEEREREGEGRKEGRKGERKIKRKRLEKRQKKSLFSFCISSSCNCFFVFLSTQYTYYIIFKKDFQRKIKP